MWRGLNIFFKKTSISLYWIWMLWSLLFIYLFPIQQQCVTFTGFPTQNTNWACSTPPLCHSLFSPPTSSWLSMCLLPCASRGLLWEVHVFFLYLRLPGGHGSVGSIYGSFIWWVVLKFIVVGSCQMFMLGNKGNTERGSKVQGSHNATTVFEVGFLLFVA